MHGGAVGSGAPHGNHNALKHGLFTAEARVMRAHISQLTRDTRKIIDQL